MSDPVIRYQVRFPRPQSHLYEITLDLDNLAPGHHRLEMAVWTPGSYLVREFSGHVSALSAVDDRGTPVATTKEKKNVWGFDCAGGSVQVRYEVYANELTVDTSHLDESHAYWNGCSLFLALDDRKDLPIEVEVEAPPDWKIATALDILAAGDGRFRLRSADYDTLLDCPVEIGSHRTFTFDALGRPHELALYGHGNEDPERLIADLRRIVEAAGAIFGGLPYERYVFIVHLVDARGGGLEHMNSTTCDADRFSFRPEAAYLSLLALFSHEFFHLWNVKRIRPEALGPFDYGEENYTTLLWAMEGITDYYADLLLARAGIWSERKYAQQLAAQIRDYEARPGRLCQSASMSSYDSWIKFYRPNEDSPNHTISYYTKGSLLGLCLDLELRALTAGRRGLDDVLRLLYERFGAHGRGFPEAVYRETVEEVAGRSMEAFWQSYVDGTQALDPGEFLAKAGLELRRTVARGERDGDAANRSASEGGGAEGPSADAAGEPRSDLGVVPILRDGRLVVRHVLASTAAEDAGIYVDDELLAVDGYRTPDGPSLSARVADHRPGDDATVTVSRRGELITLNVRLGIAPPDDYRIASRERPSDEERAVYAGWLGARQYPPPGGLESAPPKPTRRVLYAERV